MDSNIQTVWQWKDDLTMEDRRVQRSKEAIRECFLALLREKRLSKITVSEICRMANIGRGTFYLHYADVYDLYDSIEDELYQGLYQLFESCYPTTEADNSLRLAEGLTSYVEANKDIFLLLVGSENCRSLQKLLRVFHEKVVTETRRVDPDSNVDYEQIEAVFTVSGIVGVLEEWLKGGMIMPRGRVAAMLNRVMCKLNANR